MKTLKIGAFAMLGLLAVACNDDDNNNTAKLSSEEQAEMVASSLGRSGFVGSAEQSASYADDASASGKLQECGWTNDGSFNIGTDIGQIVFSLSYNYDVALNCNGDNEPESFVINFNYSGSYDGSRFESEYSGSGDLTITQLGDDEDSFKVNGSYDRAGSFVTKVNGNVSEEGEHSIEINVNNVMISKSNHEVMNGSADVSASGSIKGRGRYSFDADVTFSNNGTTKMAVIRVAGDTYNLNLESNVMTKVED